MSKRQNMETGAVLSLVLLMAGLVAENPLWNKLAGLTLLLTVLAPAVYRPLAWLWFGLGRWTERFFSTLVLGLVFYLVVTPVAWLRRRFSADTLRLRAFKKERGSVFAVRDKTYRAEDLEKQY